MTKNNIVVVNDLDPNVAGAISYWRLSGKVDYIKLVKALEAKVSEEESIPLPPQTSPEKALRRACREHMTPKGRILRKMDGDAHGWEMFEEESKEEDGNKLVHNRLFSAKVDRWIEVDDPSGKYGTRLEEDFRAHLDTITHADVSAWLVRCVYKMSALAMRDSGGIYFVPRHRLPIWKAVRASLQAAGQGNEVFTIPAMRTEDTIDAVIDSLQSEAQATMEALEKEVAEASLGSKAIRNRADQCNVLTAKVQRYEELLGRKQKALTDKIAALQGELVAAAFALEAEEEAA